jgi:hypothetical protein
MYQMIWRICTVDTDTLDLRVGRITTDSTTEQRTVTRSCARNHCLQYCEVSHRTHRTQVPPEFTNVVKGQVISLDRTSTGDVNDLLPWPDVCVDNCHVLCIRSHNLWFPIWSLPGLLSYQCRFLLVTMLLTTTAGLIPATVQCCLLFPLGRYFHQSRRPGKRR